MKKIALLSILLILCFNAIAQDYCFGFSTNRTPYGYNACEDTVTTGWTVISKSATSQHYTNAIKLPFPVRFKNTLVTHFKASTTGILTFDTSVSGTPLGTIQTLPSTFIPNKSICVQGLKASKATSAIMMKVIGRAPKRQLWVKYLNFGTYQNISSDNVILSFVMEEERNNLFHIVSQQLKITDTSNLLFLSAGIQTNATTATKLLQDIFDWRIGTYVPLGLATLGGTVRSLLTKYYDNDFYTFYPTSRTGPTDIDLVNVEPLLGLVEGKPFKINLYYRNNGFVSNWVDSTECGVSINGGSFQFQKYLGSNHSRTLPRRKRLPQLISHSGKAGDVLNIKVWLKHLGINADSNTYNDTFTIRAIVGSGKSNARRKILYEAFTSAQCATCPDNEHEADTMNINLKDTMISLYHHMDDMMARPWNDYYSVYFYNYHFCGYNRKLGSEITTCHDVFFWGEKSDDIREAAKSPYNPAKISIISKTFDTLSRKLDYTVQVEFSDYALSSFSIGSIISEDEQRGVGFGWDQKWTSLPMLITGQKHKNVMIDCPGGIFGVPIADTLIKPGKRYTQSFTYILPPKEIVTIPSTAVVSPTGLVVGRYDPKRINILFYVALNDDAYQLKEILNVDEINLLDTIKPNSISEFTNSNNEIRFYPNPVSSKLYLFGSDFSNTNYSISDINGRRIASGLVSKDIVNVEELAAGTYLLELQLSNQQKSIHKFIKN